MILTSAKIFLIILTSELYNIIIKMEIEYSTWTMNLNFWCRKAQGYYDSWLLTSEKNTAVIGQKKIIGSWDWGR